MSSRSAVWLHGYSGRMGKELRNLITQNSQAWELIGGSTSSTLVDHKAGKEEGNWSQLPSYLEKTDLIIDFSNVEGNAHIFAMLGKQPISRKAILLGTTGLTNDQIKAWKAYAAGFDIRLLIAPNTSLGILLTLKVSELMARVLSPLHFDIEILETHHRAKVDAPSGTAKILAKNLAGAIDKEIVYAREGQRSSGEIGLASLRGGSVYGEHEVRYLGDHEELKISHKALNRQLFAQGALLLGQWLLQKSPGIYGLEDVSIEEMVQLLQKSSIEKNQFSSSRR